MADLTTTANLTTPDKDLAQTSGDATIEELNPPDIHWFYKLSTKSNWVAFRGRDSLLIELKWRMNKKEALGDDFADKEEELKLCQNSIVVLDGYYELLFGEELVAKPIYWKGETVKILRGTWFYEEAWLPVNPKLANIIEENHMKRPVNESKVLHAVDQENCPNILKLHRGYRTSALYSDGPLPINKLVFVVHGIGQKRHVDRIVANTDGIRRYAERMIKESSSQLQYRPMFLPIEWRTSLKLDEGIVKAITPSKLQFLRDLLNSTVMDIMYYSSPKYRSEVIDGMVSVLNRFYELFAHHNPHFEDINGEISILAHSLGSVICYDVITGWSPLQQYEEFVTKRLKHAIDSPFVSQDSKENLTVLDNVRKQLEENEGGLLKVLLMADVSSMQLTFQVQHLFCLGSPLGLFLALRGEVGRKIFEHKHPKLHNLFHPNDPVAYRLEPLVHPLYAKTRPLRIYRHDNISQIPYENEKMPVEITEVDLSQIPKDCRLSYRIDYALKEWTLDYIPLSAVTAHANYWTNPDVTMFVLKQLYGYKPSS